MNDGPHLRGYDVVNARAAGRPHLGSGQCQSRPVPSWGMITFRGSRWATRRYSTDLLTSPYLCPSTLRPASTPHTVICSQHDGAAHMDVAEGVHCEHSIPMLPEPLVFSLHSNNICTKAS